MRLVDLTQPYRQGDVSEIGAVDVARLKAMDTDGMNTSAFTIETHHVTHLDAPIHLVRDGRGIADFELRDLSGPAVCLRARRGGGEAITTEELQSQEPAVQVGDIVFINTGWNQYFGVDPTQYLFSPYLSADAVDWLLSRKVKVVGVDGPTPEMPRPLRPPGFNFPVHQAFLGSGTLICEHMTNLDQLAGRRFRAYLFPLPLMDGDGSPVRAVAELDDGD